MSDYLSHRQVNSDVTVSSVLAAADNLSVTPRTLVAAQAKVTIYVQKIIVAVITDNAATLQFKDSAGTPVVIAGTKASPGIGPIHFDFGDKGRPLTEGTALNLSNSAAGLAADITVQAYRRRTGAGIPNP